MARWGGANSVIITFRKWLHYLYYHSSIVLKMVHTRVTRHGGVRRHSEGSLPFRMKEWSENVPFFTGWFEIVEEAPAKKKRQKIEIQSFL